MVCRDRIVVRFDGAVEDDPMAARVMNEQHGAGISPPSELVQLAARGAVMEVGRDERCVSEIQEKLTSRVCFKIDYLYPLAWFSLLNCKFNKGYSSIVSSSSYSDIRSAHFELEIPVWPSMREDSGEWSV